MSTEDKELGKGLRTCPESKQNAALLKKKKKSGGSNKQS